MMGFRDFQGSAEVVDRLRDMMARNRFPHAVVLAGPHGSGKYTLALMLARAQTFDIPAAMFRFRKLFYFARPEQSLHSIR